MTQKPTMSEGVRDTPREENPLQRLIQEQRRQRGLSYGDIAEAGGLSRSTVYYLARTNPLLRTPSASTLDGLARGLGIHPDRIRLAAAEAVGVHVYHEGGAETRPDLEVLMASLEALTESQRRHVAALVQSLLSQDPQAPQPGEDES